MAAAFLHKKTVGLVFIVHHIYRLQEKTFKLLNYYSAKAVEQRNLINIKLTSILFFCHENCGTLKNPHMKVH